MTAQSLLSILIKYAAIMTQNNNIITRFAPSPTGHLHLGHIRAAFEAFDFAAQHNGQCMLRIEDIDHTRCRDKFTQSIYDDLAWLGFSWPQPVRVQSDYLSDYQLMLEHLRQRGFAYPCFKSRKDIDNENIANGGDMADEDLLQQDIADEDMAETPAKPSSETLSDEQIETRIAAGERYALRLSIKACREKFDGSKLHYINNDKDTYVNFDGLEDIIIGRKDIGISYHIAVTHDDALQNISHVIRGKDLMALTPYHVILHALMGWPIPQYYHHALITDSSGKKLSKRDKANSIASYKNQGLTRQDIKEMAGL